MHDAPPICLIERYYDLIRANAGQFTLASAEFEPAMALPDLDLSMREFLAPASAQFFSLGHYHDVPLRLLDLRQNPATQTSKTFAATLIVARAVRHIQDTGEPVLLFSPSSGNQAVALRDAVLRALQAGLAERHHLRVITLTPQQTVNKLRRSELYECPELRFLNPVFVLEHPTAEWVKRVAEEFKVLYHLRASTALRLWHAKCVDNYRFADQARAFFDFEYGDAWDLDRRTLHVQAVSSACGLLGYCSGIDALQRDGRRVATPEFLLVQHLASSDLVKHLLGGQFGEQHTPLYAPTDQGLWVQGRSAHFPASTWNPHETLETSLYSHVPPTAAEMTARVRSNGGSGIVVSLHECLQRYGECARLLADTPVKLPSDPRELGEWSLVMALTGCMNALDRNLVVGIDSCTVHASGSYAHGDYACLPQDGYSRVRDAGEMLGLLSQTLF